MAVERLKRIRYGTRLLHESLAALWDLPEPENKRTFAVRGFANIVRQHVLSQLVLVQKELDVSATALVRPTYEALVRSIWVMRGAEDEWVEGFFSAREEAITSDAETRKGPDVVAMLHTISRQHPEGIHHTLVELKDKTWRAMHSYVHGGIRPVVQSFCSFPHHEAGSLIINANGMLLLATNVVRMAHGLQSPTLPVLQRQYFDCLPPADESGIRFTS